MYRRSTKMLVPFMGAFVAMAVFWAVLIIGTVTNIVTPKG